MSGKKFVFAALAGATLVACGGASPDAVQTNGPSTDAVAAGTSWIYRDAMVSPWYDWSWASRTLANPSPVAAGTASMRVSFGPWQGLNFHRSAVAVSDYSAVVLSVNGGTGSGAVLQVRALLGNGTVTTGVALGPNCAGGAIPAGQWTSCRVPITAIAPAGSTLSAVVIQEWKGLTLPAMYFDEIGLEPAVAQQAVTVAVSPSTASIQTSQTVQLGASVTGTTNTAVTWSVQEGAAGGTVSSAGLYTAPSTAGTYHVIATSQADATRSASAAVTVTSPAPPPPPPPPPPSSGGKESWVWVYVDFANVLNSVANNKASFTHLSPTFYTVNYNYQSGVAYYSNCPNISNCTGPGTNWFSGLTTKQFTDRVKAMGLKTVAAIYGGAGNSGVDTGIQNILNNTNGAGDSFVAAMTAEAVANGYDGYNIDWEGGAGLDATYADKFVAFVNKFKAALSPYGMSLSVDAIVSDINGTWCSGNNGFIDFPKLAASTVDRVIIEDYTSRLGTQTTSCQNVVLSSTKPALCDFTVTGMLNMMCSPNLPLDKAVIGLEADPYATNSVAGAAFSAIQSYGFTRVAVWPQYPFMNATNIQPAGATWYGLLQNFLTH